jgi:hypothetical protein
MVFGLRKTYLYDGSDPLRFPRDKRSSTKPKIIWIIPLISLPSGSNTGTQPGGLKGKMSREEQR